VIKYAILLLLVVVVWRWALGFWPWEGIAGPTRRERIERARRLLGVGRGAGRGEIEAAHRRLISKVHPDRGGSSEAVHEANDARDLLLEEAGPPAADEDDPSE
jgi:hypothetical protein